VLFRLAVGEPAAGAAQQGPNANAPSYRSLFNGNRDAHELGSAPSETESGQPGSLLTNGEQASGFKPVFSTQLTNQLGESAREAANDEQLLYKLNSFALLPKRFSKMCIKVRLQAGGRLTAACIYFVSIYYPSSLRSPGW